MNNTTTLRDYIASAAALKEPSSANNLEHYLQRFGMLTVKIHDDADINVTVEGIIPVLGYSFIAHVRTDCRWHLAHYSSYLRRFVMLSESTIVGSMKVPKTERIQVFPAGSDGVRGSSEIALAEPIFTAGIGTTILQRWIKFGFDAVGWKLAVWTDFENGNFGWKVDAD